MTIAISVTEVLKTVYAASALRRRLRGADEGLVTRADEAALRRFVALAAGDTAIALGRRIVRFEIDADDEIITFELTGDADRAASVRQALEAAVGYGALAALRDAAGEAGRAESYRALAAEAVETALAAASSTGPLPRITSFYY